MAQLMSLVSTQLLQLAQEESSQGMHQLQQASESNRAPGLEVQEEEANKEAKVGTCRQLQLTLSLVA